MNHDFVNNHFSKWYPNLEFPICVVPKPNKIIPKIVLKPIIALNLRRICYLCSPFLLFSYLSSSFLPLLPSSYLVFASVSLFDFSNQFNFFLSQPFSSLIGLGHIMRKKVSIQEIKNFSTSVNKSRIYDEDDGAERAHHTKSKIRKHNLLEIFQPSDPSE